LGLRAVRRVHRSPSVLHRRSKRPHWPRAEEHIAKPFAES